MVVCDFWVSGIKGMDAFIWGDHNKAGKKKKGIFKTSTYKVTFY
jgi:hypothetical protein